MEKISRESRVAEVRAETENPLWVITVMLGIFFAAAGALIALG